MLNITRTFEYSILNINIQYSIERTPRHPNNPIHPIKQISQRWKSPACAYLWNHKKKEVISVYQ